MTTLRVEQDTKEQLRLLKDEFNASSYDELLRKMITETRKRISMFGADPGIDTGENPREHTDRY